MGGEGDSEQLDEIWLPLLCREHTKRDAPPHLGSAKCLLPPIIFRTKNTEKSRLGVSGKICGKNLRENETGEGKAPNLVERG